MRFLILAIILLFSSKLLGQSDDTTVQIEILLHVRDENAPSNLFITILENDSLIFSDSVYVPTIFESVWVTSAKLNVNTKYTILTTNSSGVVHRDIFDTFAVKRHTRYVKEIGLMMHCDPIILPELEFKKNKSNLTRGQKVSLLQLCDVMRQNPTIVVKCSFTHSQVTSGKIVDDRNTNVLSFLELHIDHIERIVIKNIDGADSSEVENDKMICEITSFDFVH